MKHAIVPGAKWTGTVFPGHPQRNTLRLLQVWAFLRWVN